MSSAPRPLTVTIARHKLELAYRELRAASHAEYPVFRAALDAVRAAELRLSLLTTRHGGRQ